MDAGRGVASTGVAVPARHDLLWVRGAEAVGFVDGLLSQDVKSMKVGSVARAFLLQSRGKLEALLWVLRGEGEVGLAVDAGHGARVAGVLERFRFRVDAAVEPPEGNTATVWGDGTDAILGQAGLVVPAGWSGAGGTVVASMPLGGLPRCLVAGPAAGRIEVPGDRSSAAEALEAFRIECGEPVMGVDVDGDTMPHETGMVGAAVSFAKGCYLGQELVARIESRGRVNRHLRLVVIEGQALPPPGSTLEVGGTAVGVLTSRAVSPRREAAVGLAMVRRQMGPGGEVGIRWDGGAARGWIEELPGCDPEVHRGTSGGARADPGITAG